MPASADSPLLTASSQWFDDWREWTAWTATHGPGDLPSLEQQCLAAGRRRLSAAELVLHAHELNNRANAWATLCRGLCAEFGLCSSDYERLPAPRRALYARIPDSPVWAPVQGTYLRKEAIDYLHRRIHREATEPLVYQRGVTCLRCGHHHDWHSFRDIRQPPDDAGFPTYRCSQCGCAFVFYQGREMTRREADAAADHESRAAVQALDPQPWYIRLLAPLLGPR